MADDAQKMTQVSQRQPMTKIAMFAGASGGHLFPAVSVAETLRRTYPDLRLVLVTSRKGQAFCANISGGLFDEIFYLENFPAPRGISLKTLSFLLKLAHAFWQTFFILRSLRPQVCLGFGSYASFPGIVLAHRMKIPTVIHEQNYSAGRATAQLAAHADLILTSFPESLKLKAKAPQQHVGLPLRRDLNNRASAGAAGNTPSDYLRVLVMGGSQGARKINDVFLRVLTGLEAPEKSKLAVKHITGKNDFEALKKSYSESEIEAEVFPFFENMSELYEWADWAVVRGGANTLFELAAFSVPAFVVPYPYAGAHQAENARFFERRGGVICCLEEDLNEAALRDVLRQALSDRDSLQRMRDAQKKSAHLTAAEDFVKSLESLKK